MRLKEEISPFLEHSQINFEEPILFYFFNETS